MTVPRVAFFTDSFHEVNGVGLTSRQFAAFAKQREYPFLSIHPGRETCHIKEVQFETFELKSSPAVLWLEPNLAFDLLFFRHLTELGSALKQFKPDLIHVTGPGHCGLLGAILAHRLRVPFVASWHTNVHEFAGRRFAGLFPFLPASWRRGLSGLAEKISLQFILAFYRLARLLYAPNPELVDMLSRETGRATHLMLRGIDTTLFSPALRTSKDDTLVIGYVGRLSAEKNVRLLGSIEQRLIACGLTNYRFLIVGEGGERRWLEENLVSRELTGVLRGEGLARAYANMDVFLFPSETDTFGNVVLEAMSSGLPSIVSAGGGPKFLVRQGREGLWANGVDEFAQAVLNLAERPDLRRQMGASAREASARFSWDHVFGEVYRAYSDAFAPRSARNAIAARAADIKSS